MTVSLDRRDRVLVLTLDRPEAANAINRAMSEAFCTALRDARRDPAVGGVVLTGRGERVFCAGADLKNPDNLPPDAITLQRSATLLDMLDAVAAFDKPLVAAVNGAAAGGGMMLALLTDAVFMAEAARFAMPEIDVGMSSPLGLALLTELLGPGLAADLVLSGRRLEAAEAGRRDVARVVPLAGLLEAANGHAAMLAAKPAAAYAGNKAWLRQRRQSIIEANRRRPKVSEGAHG